MRVQPGVAYGALVAWLVLACSSSGESPSRSSASSSECGNGQCGGCKTCVETCVCQSGSQNVTACSQACGSAGGAGGSGGSIAGSGGSSVAGAGGSGLTGSGGSGLAGAGTGGAAGSGGSTSVDPNAPIVEISGLACGGVLDADFQSPFVQIGGRQVYVDYACNKPRGTPVTFILNLHGTMDQESGRQYIRGYFPTHQYTDSHDFIIATPKSVVSQWGNNDGGQDEPHLMAVIQWMYDNFTGFDIRQMWIVGHSWGAMYTRTFACKAELSDKVHGVVLMSGGSGMPACSDRLAAMGTVGETDIVPGELTQGATASAHGCAAQSTRNLGNDVITEWASCDPGWVHRNYLMLGKGHGFTPTDWPDTAMVDEMVDAIASTR